jgi:ABC-2 type transport system ATP-binding protein
MTAMGESPHPLVAIEQVTKSFNKHAALDNLSVIIPHGKIVGLVGPDGAGKTTLLRLIAGLMVPTRGTISVAGYDTVTQADRIAELIGYMPQKFGLYEDLTVIQNLSLYADLKNVKGVEKEESFRKLLAFTALAPFTERLAGALSGGMKQKLGLACALLGKPTLLLLDEPSVGVDPISRRELWKMVAELLMEGISVVWSTAYLDEAEKCDSIILLNEGKLLFRGVPQELNRRVEGRTFKITSIEGSRRQLLEKALCDSHVIDGVIQGSDVRIVVRDKNLQSFDLSSLDGGGALQLIAVEPRFEDAFIDILGGGPGGVSPLAAQMPLLTADRGIVIDARSLTKKFGSFVAANEITFAVPRGKIFGLLGPNGAGKSTTFKMLCGLLTPTSGQALVIGLDLQEAPSQARQRIGYMAQKFSLYSDLSVLQNLNFFSGIYGLKGTQRLRTLDEMVAIFNFDEYLSMAAGALPLGYKQRLALACAVMHRPEVLFLDEPTSGVDPITRREFWTHINGLVERGITVMITTHFMDEAEYCDEIALVYRGQIIQKAPPDQLKNLAQTKENLEPTLEDAFILLIQQYDAIHHE